MNNIRQVIGIIFKAPMQNMTFVQYFSYLNEGGKLTSRAVQDVLTVLAIFAEEQEKRNEQYEQNFKDIQEVLEKLVNKAPVRPIQEPIETKPEPEIPPVEKPVKKQTK